MAKNSSSMGNILFRIFWWVVQHVNLNWAHKLMYMGLRDGAFPRQRVNEPQLQNTLWGHLFPSPFGVGEGVDTQGNVIDELIYTGFSFGEFGPYTLEKEMPDTKTLFFSKQKAMLIQSLGYRNPGILKVLPGLVKRRYLPHYVGIDLAIPAESEEQNIKQGRHFSYEDEFVLMSQKVAPYCDYIVLNLSHPEAELATLIVDKATISPIVKSVKDAVRLAAPIQTPPIWVKIPLDINLQEIPLVVQSLMEAGADGVVVAGPLAINRHTNLHLSDKEEYQMGMLSGEPVREKVLELIRHIYRQSQGKLPIISCGGVFTPEDAFKNLSAGASLIQVDEAAMLFNSPSIVFNLQKGLVKLMTEKGYPTMDKLIGADFRIGQVAQQPFAQQPVPSQTPVQENVSSAPVSASVSTPVPGAVEQNKNPTPNQSNY